MSEENQVEQQEVNTEQQEQEQHQVEKEARIFGWVPKEEFRGSDSDWVDAEVL